jgi:hypothetical protein
VFCDSTDDPNGCWARECLLCHETDRQILMTRNQILAQSVTQHPLVHTSDRSVFPCGKHSPKKCQQIEQKKRFSELLEWDINDIFLRESRGWHCQLLSRRVLVSDGDDATLAAFAFPRARSRAAWEQTKRLLTLIPPKMVSDARRKKQKKKFNCSARAQKAIKVFHEIMVIDAVR